MLWTLLQDHAQRTVSGTSSSSNQSREQIQVDGKTVAIDLRETERCAGWYPNQDIAVVSDIGKPPLPPDGNREANVGSSAHTIIARSVLTTFPRDFYSNCRLRAIASRAPTTTPGARERRQ